MKRKVYKVLTGIIFSGFGLASAVAQTPVQPPKPPAPQTKTAEIPDLKWDDQEFDAKMKDMSSKLNEKLRHLNEKLSKIDFKELDLAMTDLGKKLGEQFKDFDKNLHEQLKDIEKNLNDKNTNYKRDNQGDYKSTEKSKVISKSYPVDRNDKLAINNQYGKVVINTWNKNEIKVDIEIKAYEGSESRAQELLDGVTITDSKQANLISFKTDIRRGSSHWFASGRNERRGVEINYMIYMPSKNLLDITNKYGNTLLPDFDGALNVNSSYGSFTGKNLSNTGNNIKVSYGSANIEGLNSGNLEISYGSLKLGSADKLSAHISYSPASIGKLSGDGDLNVKYSGGLKIDQIDNKLKNLHVNASYSAITLGFNESANFAFDVTVSYAGFNYDDNKINIISTAPDQNSKGWSPTKNYKGQHGKESDSKVIIKSNYGSVRFQ